MELRIPTAPTAHWLEEARRRWSLGIRVRACQPDGPRGRRLLQQIEYTARPADATALLRFLRQRPEVEEISVVSSSSSRGLLLVVTPMPALCGHVFSEGAVCSNCRLLLPPDATPPQDWTVVVPPGPRLRRFLARVTGANFPQGRSIGIRPYAPPKDLTPRQLAALATAHRMGYYGFPRVARLGEVARALGVSRPAASELLRRGEAKLVSVGLELLREDGTGVPGPDRTARG